MQDRLKLAKNNERPKERLQESCQKEKNVTPKWVQEETEGSGDAYTDENPKDTVSIKFSTPTDARNTVAK